MKPTNPVSEIKQFAKNSIELNKGAQDTLIQATQLALGKPLPNEFCEIYRVSDGLDVVGKSSRIHFLPLEQVTHFNEHDDLLEFMPGIVLFAFDQGENFFFIDPENLLKHGFNAIFSCSMGGRRFKYSQFIAETFTHFLKRVREDDELLDGRLLQETRPDLFTD